jgi:hypothetical protein
MHTNTDRSRHPVERMAEDMRNIAAASGGVTAEDLEQIGWKKGDIARFGDDAKRRAQRLSATKH